jgi:hypothetical protein
MNPKKWSRPDSKLKIEHRCGFWYIYFHDFHFFQHYYVLFAIKCQIWSHSNLLAYLCGFEKMHDLIISSPLRCKNIPANQFQKPIITIQGLTLEAQCIKGALLLILALRRAVCAHSQHSSRPHHSPYGKRSLKYKSSRGTCVFNDWYDAHNKRTTRRTKSREPLSDYLLLVYAHPRQ